MTGGRPADALRAVLADATATLRRAGLDAPDREAEVLLAAALGVPIASLHASPPDAGRDALDAFRSHVARRAAREPAAYILGRAGFWTLDLEVNPDVLVPRPETERLVDEALRLLAERPAAPRVVDVGTGSGCIPVALAVERSDLRAVGIDRSAAALAVAARNARANGVAARVRLVRGDLLHGVRGPFDLVVSNPPYVGDGEEVDPEVLREPRGAVFAGPDALALYGPIAAGAARVLRPGGTLLLETPGARVDEIAARVAAAGLVPGEPVADLDGRPRVLPARKP